MKILIPIDVWQTETNAHLAKDLAGILPVAHAHLVVVYSLQSEPHMEKAAAVAAQIAGSTSEGMGILPLREPRLKKAAVAADLSPDYFYSELEKKAKEHLQELAKDLQPICASVETVFEHGPPAKVIAATAEAEGADLTVIRGSAAGLLESVFMGNTISQVIKHSHNATLVLRSGPVLKPLTKVIIALDGSQTAKESLKQFCRLYQPMQKQLEVILCHVVSIPGPWRFVSPVEFVATLEDNLDMAAKAILAEGEALLISSGWKPGKMPIPMVVRTGDVAMELDRLASEIGAGLIVLGAQGKTAMQSFLLGSVSEALSLKSSFPILVFK